MNRNRFFFLIGVLVVMLFAAPAVLAHANLERSEPAANSANKIPPTRVRLWFSEQVEPSFSTVNVLDRSGSLVDKGDAQRSSDDAMAMQVSLPVLPEGLYTVVWKALSAVDGHVTNGSFSFTVGDVSLSDTSPREVIALVDETMRANAFPPLDQVIVRWLNVLLLSLLVGGFVFPVAVLFPARVAADGSKPIARAYREYVAQLFRSPARVPAENDAALAVWGARWLMLARGLFVLYTLATIASLVSHALTVGDGFTSIPRVLTTTRFGTIWLVRVVMLGFLGNEVFRARWQWSGDVRAKSSLFFALAFGGLLLVTQGLNSHGAAISAIPLIVDVIHLLGVVVWVGGLFQLFVTLPTFIRSMDPPYRARMLSAVIGAFSLIAFMMVGIVTVTGIYSMIVQVGSLEAFFNTFYGATLLIKFLLIVPLLALGAFNLIVIRPGAFRRRFNLIVALEVVFAIAVLVAVGVLTSVAPARSAFKLVSPLWLETQRADDLRVTLGIAPGLVGANDFDVRVQDANGQAIADATVVRLLASMAGRDMGVQEIAATNQGKGHYTMRSNLLSVLGEWQVQVLVRRAGRDDALATFAFVTAVQRTPETIQPLLSSNRDIQIGLGLTLFSLVIGIAGAVLIRRRGARLFNLGGAIVIAILGTAAIYQTVANAAVAPILITPVAPGSARLMRSPIPLDANQLAAGRDIYQQNCQSCHGITGKGDGPAAVALNPKPFDLTVHAPLHTEGELYWWVTNGIPGTAMVGWESKLTDLQRWQVVAYIRTIGASASPAR